MDKLIMNGTEYELDYNGPCDSTNTPEILFKGRAYIGKAIKNKPTKDYEIIERYNYGEVPCDGDIAPIKSVKRLSDGEVFTIGDKVCYAPNPQTNWVIDNFSIRSDKKLLARSKRNLNVEIVDDDLKKVKFYLFTTSYGKKIFEDDMVWVVNSAWAMPFKVRATKEWYEETKSHFNYFSSKENAEAFVIKNKPCLCLADIYSLWSISPGDLTIIEELVKRKLASS